MTSSQNFPAAMEPWMYRSSPFSDTWLSDSFTRDSEVLTKALQQSLSSEVICTPPAPVTTTTTGSGSDPEPVASKKTIPAVGKPTKRRSRASKKATTTYISADPVNFRQMVQQVTGVRLPGDGVGYQTAAVGAGVFKPEPQRLQGCLPTLDTSSYLLQTSAAPVFAPVSATPQTSMGADGFGFDFDAFSCFPTLESGKANFGSF